MELGLIERNSQLELYPLTPGQVDAIAGVDKLADLNSNVLPVALTSARRIDTVRLTAALQAMQRAHPSLRLRLVAWDNLVHSKQRIEVDNTLALVLHREAADVDLPESVSRCFTEIAARIDLAAGPVCGVVLLHTPSQDYLVFGFNHFTVDVSSLVLCLRTFEQAYRSGERPEARSDTYLQYLQSIKTCPSWSDLPEGARWWVRRPWNQVSPMAGINRTRIGAFDLGQHSFVKVAPWRGGHDPRAVERAIITALARSAAEQAERAAPIRLDVCRNGRYGRTSRLAVGWLSQVVPHIIDVGQESEAPDYWAQFDEVERHEADWSLALEYMRTRAVRPAPLCQGAQIYVNFHGSFEPTNCPLGQFSYSHLQPSSLPPIRRRSFTPIRVMIRRFGDELRFIWRFSDMFHDLKIPHTVADRAMSLLEEAAR
jgi:hypothetical protein